MSKRKKKKKNLYHHTSFLLYNILEKKLTTFRAPQPSIGILNNANSGVTIRGLQVELPAVTSIEGERGGSVREAGTEKTKWRSIVHSGGGHTHRYTCIVM